MKSQPLFIFGAIGIVIVGLIIWGSSGKKQDANRTGITTPSGAAIPMQSTQVGAGDAAYTEPQSNPYADPYDPPTPANNYNPDPYDSIG